MNIIWMLSNKSNAIIRSEQYIVRSKGNYILSQIIYTIRDKLRDPIVKNTAIFLFDPKFPFS